MSGGRLVGGGPLGERGQEPTRSMPAPVAGRSPRGPRRARPGCGGWSPSSAGTPGAGGGSPRWSSAAARADRWIGDRRGPGQGGVRGSRRVVVLGCTGGAGQSTTALMLGHTLARYRDDRVVAVDANIGGRDPDQQGRAGDARDADARCWPGCEGKRLPDACAATPPARASGLEVVGGRQRRGAEQRLADRDALLRPPAGPGHGPARPALQAEPSWTRRPRWRRACSVRRPARPGASPRARRRRRRWR